MELQVTLHTLLTRLPGLRFADSADDVVWKSGVSTRGPERMPDSADDVVWKSGVSTRGPERMPVTWDHA